MVFRSDLSAVADIQRKIIKRDKRNVVARSLSPRQDKEIAAWRLDLVRIIHVFNVRSQSYLQSRLSTLRS